MDSLVEVNHTAAVLLLDRTGTHTHKQGELKTIKRTQTASYTTL